MELAYIRVLETRFWGFNSPLAHNGEYEVVAAFLIVNQAVWVRIPLFTPLENRIIGSTGDSESPNRGSNPFSPAMSLSSSGRTAGFQPVNRSSILRNDASC